MRSLVAAAGLLLALAGCVDTSPVTPMGRDTYMIGTDARGGLTSTESLITRNAQVANAFCAQSGKEMEPANVMSQGVRGWTPQETTLIFRCLNPDDPANQRPNLRREPNAIIELRQN